MAKLRMKSCDLDEDVVIQKNYGRLDNIPMSQLIVEEGKWVLYNEYDFYGACVLLSKEGGSVKRYAIACWIQAFAGVGAGTGSGRNGSIRSNRD